MTFFLNHGMEYIMVYLKGYIKIKIKKNKEIKVKIKNQKHSLDRRHVFKMTGNNGGGGIKTKKNQQHKRKATQ